MNETLLKELKKIDRLLKKHQPHVFNSLLTGTENLSVLHTITKDLSDDLKTWFLWHDGQEGVDPVSPMNNYTLLSATQVVDSWKFLTDPEEDIEQEFKPTWIPIMTMMVPVISLRIWKNGQKKHKNVLKNTKMILF